MVRFSFRSFVKETQEEKRGGERRDGKWRNGMRRTKRGVGKNALVMFLMLQLMLMVMMHQQQPLQTGTNCEFKVSIECIIHSDYFSLRHDYDLVSKWRKVPFGSDGIHGNKRRWCRSIPWYNFSLFLNHHDGVVRHFYQSAPLQIKCWYFFFSAVGRGIQLLCLPHFWSWWWW